MKTERKSPNKPAAATIGSRVKKGMQSPSRPLESNARASMETRFGHDFSQVRIHAGEAARESAESLHAQAYTLGNHIVLGAGQDAAGTSGWRLLAHELTHVVQQGGAEPNLGAVTLGAASSESEREAQRTADAVSSGPLSAPVVSRIYGGGGTVVQRQPLSGPDDFQLSYSSPMAASMAGSLTLDGFALNKSELTPAHKERIPEHAKTMVNLLKDFPDSFVSIVGHTDATGNEAHNKPLGQDRADTVLEALVSAGVPREVMRSASLGESVLRVETQTQEPRNRRVEINFTARKSNLRVLPDLRPTDPSKPGVTPPNLKVNPCILNPSLCESGNAAVPGDKPAEAKPKPKEWLKEALERDELLRELPDFLRKKAIDGLKDADEALADKIIDALPWDDQHKSAMKAVFKSLLQLAKRKKFEVPTPTPHEMPPSVAPPFPKAPGEVIVPGPTWRF